MISHRSAVLGHDLPLLGPRPPVPELTVRPRSNANFHDAHPYRAALRDCDVRTVGGAKITSIARTLVDLGRHRPLQTAVVAIDAALNRRLVTPAEIEDVLRCCWNWPMIRRAQLAVRLCDGRAESPLESISRLVFPYLRLPIPEVHRLIFDQGGVLVADTDFYWDEFGVVGEADGRDKYDGRDVLALEKERQELLEQLGLVVVRWGWDDAYARPYRLRSRLDSGFERGRLRDRSGFPRLWSL